MSLKMSSFSRPRHSRRSLKTVMPMPKLSTIGSKSLKIRQETQWRSSFRLITNSNSLKLPKAYSITRRRIYSLKTRRTGLKSYRNGLKLSKSTKRNRSLARTTSRCKEVNSHATGISWTGMSYPSLSRICGTSICEKRTPSKRVRLKMLSKNTPQWPFMRLGTWETGMT